jgi:hypothetical protein
MQSRMSSCRSSANDFDTTEHETPAESSSAFPLLLHDDNQRLILGSSAVVDQSFDACAGVLIPSEMDEIGSDDPGLRRDSAHGRGRIKRRAKLCLKVADFRDGSIASSPIQATFFRSPPVSRHAPPKSYWL